MNAIALSTELPVGSPLISRLSSIIDMCLRAREDGKHPDGYQTGAVIVGQRRNGLIVYYTGHSIRNRATGERTCAEKRAFKEFDKREPTSTSLLGIAIATRPRPERDPFCAVYNLRPPCEQSCQPMIMGHRHYYPELPLILIDPDVYTSRPPNGLLIVDADTAFSFDPRQHGLSCEHRH